MFYPAPPALPLDELTTLGGVLTGASKLTDPHDIHAAMVVAFYATSILFPDPIKTMTAPFAGPKVAATPAAVAKHIQAGLAATQASMAFTWNWAAILAVVIDLLKALGVAIP